MKLMNLELSVKRKTSSSAAGLKIEGHAYFILNFILNSTFIEAYHLVGETSMCFSNSPT